MLTDQYDLALGYASKLHRTQTRKGTSIPYISHLLSVSAIVLENGGDETQAIAGLLHDAVEDQGGRDTLDEIDRKFGSEVARIVEDCTDAWEEPKPAWQERKEAYLDSLENKPQKSLLVSLADKTHNAEAIAYDYVCLGDKLWDRFTGKKSGTHWYYNALVGKFDKRIPGPLADRYSRAVASFVPKEV